MSSKKEFTEKEKKDHKSPPVGSRIEASMYGINEELIKNNTKLEEIFYSALEEDKFNILKKLKWDFQPYGLTSVVILAESHAIIHTSPKDGSLMFEIYSCSGGSKDGRNAYNLFEGVVNPRRAFLNIAEVPANLDYILKYDSTDKIRKVNTINFFPQQYNGPQAGRLIFSFMDGINEELIKNNRKLERIIYSALEESRLKILKKLKWDFQPYGLTSVVILAESHAIIHTYPEYNSLILEIQNYGGSKDGRNAYNLFEGVVNPHRAFLNIAEVPANLDYILKYDSTDKIRKVNTINFFPQQYKIK